MNCVNNKVDTIQEEVHINKHKVDTSLAAYGGVYLLEKVSNIEFSLKTFLLMVFIVGGSTITFAVEGVSNEVDGVSDENDTR